jgi:small subunit ribosomal protein S18
MSKISKQRQRPVQLAQKTTSRSNGVLYYTETMAKKQTPQRRERRSPLMQYKRRPCSYCLNENSVDYRDIASLRRYISDRAKIRPRRATGACRRHQSQIAKAIKRARELALLPYVQDSSGK